MAHNYHLTGAGDLVPRHDADALHLGGFASHDTNYMAATHPLGQEFGEEWQDGVLVDQRKACRFNESRGLTPNQVGRTVCGPWRTFNGQFHT